jgi:hypothetical protein
VRLVERILLGFVVSLIAIYALDFASLKLQIPARPVLGSVDVRPEYVVRMKNGKDDISFGDTETGWCTNSWFPQLGYRPCWYARTHKQERIDVKP